MITMYTVAEDHMGESEIAQVIAFICGVIVIILMIMGLASTDWLMAIGWRQGLFFHCIDIGAPTPLPFNVAASAGCYPARDVGYIKAAAVLCIVSLVADVAATLLTVLGLRAKDHRDKHKCYRLAVLFMGLALLALLLALIVYPVFFAAELNLGNRPIWEFGWAYGVGWGAAIFLFGGVVLLFCDKESEEIYYKERKIVREEVTGGNNTMSGHRIGNHGTLRSGMTHA
ncbi:transmembrane protein 47 isoform X1 [Diachasma alloeum]|uniref:transmembrane protein 47 isoform X1 n=1 Tax=Diachasma alloeum TaxID=454923 RepID=UPI0007383DEC|nr:transmembrane protein 47 isoform X1 [Diachasma alloeum]